jgi:D-proline reductase (dithiol) PrdB
VGLVARVVEEAGIPTVVVSTGRDLTELVRPPRSLFVNFPMGNPFGRAGDGAGQRRILDRAMALFHGLTEPGLIVDAPEAWDGDFTDVVDRTLGAMSPGG